MTAAVQYYTAAVQTTTAVPRGRSPKPGLSVDKRNKGYVLLVLCHLLNLFQNVAKATAGIASPAGPFSICGQGYCWYCVTRLPFSDTATADIAPPAWYIPICGWLLSVCGYCCYCVTCLTSSLASSQPTTSLKRTFSGFFWPRRLTTAWICRWAQKHIQHKNEQKKKKKKNATRTWNVKTKDRTTRATRKSWNTLKRQQQKNTNRKIFEKKKKAEEE